MVRILLREGENKDIQTQNMGNTPLHIAARNGRYLICKYLIDNDAQIDIVNFAGQTPIEFLEEVVILDQNKAEKAAKKFKKGKEADQFKQMNKLRCDTYNLL